MSQLVRKHWSYFQLLMSTTSKMQRKHLLDTITNDQLKALVQIVINFLQRVIPIATGPKTKLRRQRHLIRRIGDRSISLKDKKILLCRQGGTIALFLKSLEPALKSFLK